MASWVAMKVFFYATGFARVPKGLFVKGAPWRSVRFPIPVTET